MKKLLTNAKVQSGSVQVLFLEPLFLLRAVTVQSPSVPVPFVVAAARRVPSCLPAGARGGGGVSRCRTQLPPLQAQPDLEESGGQCPSVLASITGSVLLLESLECTGQGLGFSHQSGYLGFPRPGDSGQGAERMKSMRARFPGALLGTAISQGRARSSPLGPLCTTW